MRFLRPLGLGVVAVGVCWAGSLHATSASTSPAAQAGATQSSQPDKSYPGLARPSDKRDLAFAIRGKVGELMVKPGDRVKAGELVMRLDDLIQRQSVELARLQAEDDTPLRTAQSTLAFREESLRRTREASQNQGASPADLRQAEYEKDVAAIKVDSTLRETQAAKVALDREMARLDQMGITSPIDGAVLDIVKRPGEAVDELTTVATIVSVNPLWIEVNVPMADSLALRLGQKATITWEDVEGRPAGEGVIIFKSPAGSGGARQVPIRVEVPNPDGLPSGMHGQVRFVEEKPR